MNRPLLLALVALLALPLGFIACGSDRPDLADESAVPGSGMGSACSTPNEGCPCSVEGQTAACGSVKQQIGDYVQCSMGDRRCIGGRWGACEGTTIVTKSIQPQPSIHTSALQATPTPCGGASACDPYCQLYSDTPQPSMTGGTTGLAMNDGGITLAGTGGSSTCTSLTISPTNPTLTITSLSTPIITNPASLTFTPTFLPAGCTPAGTQPTWVVSRPDLATISSSGTLTLFGGTVGVGIMNVQAFFASLTSNVVPITVKLRVTNDSSVAPNTAAPPGQIDKFWADNPTRSIPAATSAPSNAIWLYPYANTYFPLGLPAPVVMYKMSANPGNSVKIGLRYPSGSTAATATFEYALVVKEEACTDATQCFSDSPNKDPQIVVPPAAWKAFEETARGNDADIYIQRWAASDLQAENVRKIHFVNGQLKGTVFYGTYSSPLVGNTGAVMKIVPGATAPTVGVKMNGKCTTCHILNDTGTQAYANGYRYPSGGGFTDSQLFDLSVAPAGAPLTSSVVLRQFNNGSGTPNPGIRFNYAAARTDGRLYLTHGGSGTGDQNFRAPVAPSSFWDPTTATPTARAVTNWPNNAQAVTPRFSVAGDKIAFAYWGGNNLTATSGTIAPDANGRKIVVMDFACAAGAGCPGGTVSNARDVTPGAAAIAGGTNLMAWPSFTPDGKSVLYQRQIVNSNAYNAWSPSKLNTTSGAQAEIWMSNIPNNNTLAATPVRLNALNGLTSAGVNYLPQIPRDVNPAMFSTNFHQDGATFKVCIADNCGNCNNNVPVGSDTRLNYRPSVLPVAAGGFHWVVFASRRMYGNIAAANPWDVEPNMACTSGTPQPKKLWVAAVDSTYTPGVDPSHPAFYLPGQELEAGNSEAYWVNQQCAPVGASCEESDDCCQSPAATQCRINLPVSGTPTRSCQATSACVPTGGSCTVAGDCCGTGAVCLANVCALPTGYTASSFTRDFTAQCAAGTKVVWKLFQWQSSTPGGSTVSFSAQTGADAASLGASVSIGSAPPSSGAGTWVSSPGTVEAALNAAGQSSKSLLRVTFNLSPNGANAPTLWAWRQLYDCPPSE